MKFHMLSVVIGDTACYSNCPFCVSGEKICNENMNLPPLDSIHWKRFRVATKLAAKSGVDTVMLTSRGETTLYRNEISRYLKELRYTDEFPFVELQTNGVLLAKEWDKQSGIDVRGWFEDGLTTVTISMVSMHPEINSKIYTNGKEYIDVKELVHNLHKVGLSVRLTCVMCKDWMDTPELVLEFIEYAKEIGAEQVTMRPVNDEYRRLSAHNWILNHKLTTEQEIAIWNCLKDNGTELLKLPRVGTVFDVNGQNVMFSEPLTKYTRDTNPENGRNLIFFRDGHIRYEWEMDGGILL